MDQYDCVQVINRNFTRLFFGQAVSSVGDFVFDTTLVLWIGATLLAGKTYAPAAVSGVFIAVAAGTFLVGPIAGVFVDRWDKRRTMMVADLVRAGLVALLAVAALLPDGTIPTGLMLGLIYAVVLLATGVSQFFAPARMTLIADVVPDDDGRARASGLGQSVGYTAAIIGPPIAAPLLFTSGVEWALIINALSFVASFFLIRSIRVAPAPVAEPSDELAGRRFLGEFTSGLKFVMRNATVRVIIIMVVILTLGSGALNALMLFFTTDNLHVGAQWYGTIGMGEGIGAVVGSLTGAWVCRKIGDIRVVGLALLILGVGVFVLSQLASLPATIVLLAAMGLPLGAANVAIMPILLRSVPRDVLGRVGGILNPMQYLASMVSALLAGWLVSTVLRGVDSSVGPIHFDPINTVFVVCGLMFVVAGAYAWPGLRAATAAVPEPAEA